MRIALISPFPSDSTGFRFTVNSACTTLARAGHDVHVLYVGTQDHQTLVDGGFTCHEVRAAEIRIYSTHPMINRVLRDGQALYEKWQQLHGESPFEVLDVPIDQALGYVALLHAEVPIVLSAWEAPTTDGLTPAEIHWTQILQERCAEFAGMIEARMRRAEFLWKSFGPVRCAYGSETGRPCREATAPPPPASDNTGRICQVMTALTTRDAVSNITRDNARLLAPMGVDPKIVARHYPHELAHEIRPVLDFFRDPNCTVLFHHWNYNPDVWLLNKVRGKKAMYYHNITPPDFFPSGSRCHNTCALGYRQLGRIVNRFDLFIGVSIYNLETLRPYLHAPRPALIVPPFLDSANLQARPFNAARVQSLQADSGATHFLFVGRIARNKRQENLMALFDHYYRFTDSRAHLWLVGNDRQDPNYRHELERLRNMMDSGRNIHFTGSVTDEEMFAFYRGAHVFISASEHEGFCVPIVQSMALNLPVLGLAAAAVPETMGPDTLCVPRWDIPALADLLYRLRHDVLFRRQIITAQYKNIHRFSEPAVSERLKAAVDYLQSETLSPLLFTLEPSDHA
ncbi:MAG: glycosyltransferase family 4 protein [Kiritimatiellae bacterium]|nr:glycosyltransferase family 4 protein [Kiritimatiellia bacterium]